MKQKSTGTKHDAVNHPAHYTHGPIEVIEIIEGFKLPYHLGNAIKYILRAGHKSKDTEIQDLEKARWCLDRYIKLNKTEVPAEPTCADCLHHDASGEAVNQSMTVVCQTCSFRKAPLVWEKQGW